MGDQHYPGTDATRAAFTAIEKWGVEQAFEYPLQICSLVLDDYCFDWVLEQLEATTGEHVLKVKSRYGWWLAKASPALLEPRWERFSQLMEVKGTSETEETLSSILADTRSRLDLHALSQEACWERLERALEKCPDQEAFPHSEIYTIECCCEALTANGRADANLQAKVKDWLAFDFNKEDEVGHWRAGAAIRLAGMVGIRETVPRLLQMFDHDWDWWNEEIQGALEFMGDLEVLQIIADAYPELPRHARLYLSGLFENVWTEGMDELIYPLLAPEQAEDNIWRFGMALAQYGSTRSMEAAAGIVNVDLDHPEALPIVKTIYSQQIILDPEHPDVERWRKKIDEAERDRQNHRETLAALFANPHEFFQSPSPKQSRPQPQERIVAPREGPKIGRNDLCPCGSGKKYKKCCLS